MEIEEARKRKGEAEVTIASILQKFDKDTDTVTTKIEVMRQLAVGNKSSKIIAVLMEVKLYSK